MPNPGTTLYPADDDIQLPAAPTTTPQDEPGDGTFSQFEVFERLVGFQKAIRADFVEQHKAGGAADAHDIDQITGLEEALADIAVDSEVVHNTGNENIGGIKTFTVAPVVPAGAFPESAITGLVADLAAAVHLAGSETVTGVKDFSNSFTASGGNLRVDSAGRTAIRTPVQSDRVTNVLAGAAHPGTATTLYGTFTDVMFPSTTTATGIGAYTRVRTAAAAFTLGQMFGHVIEVPAMGAGSAVTAAAGMIINTQSVAGITVSYGLWIAAQTGGGSTAYGARIDLADTTTLWLCGATQPTTAAGGIAFGSARDTTVFRSAANTLTTGNVVMSALTATTTTLGSTSATGLTVSAGSFRVDSSGRAAFSGSAVNADMLAVISNASAHPSTATVIYGVFNGFSIPATATATAHIYYARIRTAAASFALTAAYAYFIEAPSIGAGSTIGTATGLSITNQGNASIGTSFGIDVLGQSGSSSFSYGVRIGLAASVTLWVCGSSNDVTAAGGITFGSSKDTVLFRSAANTLTTGNLSLTQGEGSAALTLTAGATNGLKIGGAAGKIAFYGATPIVQPARAAQLVDNSGGASGGNTIAVIGGAVDPTAALKVDTANAIATLAAKVNALETIIHNSGLTA